MPDKMPHFIIPHSSFILFLPARLKLAGHNEEPVFLALEAIPLRGLGEAGHLRFRVFLAVLGILHHIGESHQRIVGSRSEGVDRQGFLGRPFRAYRCYSLIPRAFP